MAKFLVLVAGLVISSQAWAGLYLEPYAGYFEGAATYSETVTLLGQSTPLSVKNNDHGALFGGKVGFGTMGFSVGADAMVGSLSSGGNSLSSTDIGAFVGFQLPILLKFGATYFVSSKLTGVPVEDSSGVTTNESAKGSGFKVGVGFSLIPLISVNIDYISHTWSNIAAVTGVTGLSLTDAGVMVGVSVPLDL